MFKTGYYQRMQKPLASSMILIPKKDGKMWFCKLDAQTIPDSYSLPSIDNLLNEAKPKLYLSTIDLKSSYHLVKVAKED